MSLVNKLSTVYGVQVSLTASYLCSDGRKRIDVTCKGKSKTCLLARVKLEIKLGRRLRKGEEVDHIDEDKTNDRYSNLQVLTRLENIKKSSKANPHKLKATHDYMRTKEGRKELSDCVIGELNPLAKFTDISVERWRNSFHLGTCTVKFIMSVTNTSRRAVQNMLSGVSYSHVSGTRAKFKRGRPPI